MYALHPFMLFSQKPTPVSNSHGFLSTSSRSTGTTSIFKAPPAQRQWFRVPRLHQGRRRIIHQSSTAPVYISPSSPHIPPSDMKRSPTVELVATDTMGTSGASQKKITDALVPAGKTSLVVRVVSHNLEALAYLS